MQTIFRRLVPNIQIIRYFRLIYGSKYNTWRLLSSNFSPQSLTASGRAENFERLYSTRRGEWKGPRKLLTKTRETSKQIKELEKKFGKLSSSIPPSELDQSEFEDLYNTITEILISAPKPRKPKIKPNFLNDLELKYLDTRGLALDVATVAKLVREKFDIVEDTETGGLVIKVKEEELLDEEDFNGLIYANAVAKRTREAEEALQLMKQYNLTPTIKSYNLLMEAYARAEDLPKAIETFKRIQDLGFSPDIYTFATVIKAYVLCSRVDDAFVIFDAMKKRELIPPQAIFTNLIWGCIEQGDLKRAWETFDEMRLNYWQPDEVSYSLMIHACAKNAEVERALNLFVELSSHNLHLTDVTCNTLIHACANRADYYNEAFGLLRQMQENYGFQPDRITYNTLLYACARKRDLNRCRVILAEMIRHSRTVERGEDYWANEVDITPDTITWTNALWCYASYQVPRSKIQNKINKANINEEIDTPETRAVVKQEDLRPLFSVTPVKIVDILKEAEAIFAYVESLIPSSSPQLPLSSQSPAEETSLITSNDKLSPTNPLINSNLINAYLAIFITHGRFKKARSIYEHIFALHRVPRDGYTYVHMLEMCYLAKDLTLAWQVWDEWESWWESKEAEMRSWLKASERSGEVNQRLLFEGRTERKRYEGYKWMVNLLARCDETARAIRLLRSLSEVSNHPRKLADFNLAYTKCVESEDEASRAEILQLCPLPTGPLVAIQNRLGRQWKGTSVSKFEVGKTLRKMVLTRTESRQRTTDKTGE